MFMGILSVAFLALVFLFWLFVIRPGDRAHHERRLELLRKKIRAAEARQRAAREANTKGEAAIGEGERERR